MGQDSEISKVEIEIPYMDEESDESCRVADYAAYRDLLKIKYSHEEAIKSLHMTPEYAESLINEFDPAELNED